MTKNDKKTSNVAIITIGVLVIVAIIIIPAFALKVLTAAREKALLQSQNKSVGTGQLGEIIGDTYHNKMYGATLKFPDRWETFPGAEGGPFIEYNARAGDAQMVLSLFRQPFLKRGVHGISGGVDSIKDFLTLKEVVESLTKTTLDRSTEVKIVSAREDVINENDVFIIELERVGSVSGASYKTKEIYYFFAKGNIRYSIEGWAPIEQYDMYKDTFMNSAETLMITKTWAM